MKSSFSQDIFAGDADEGNEIKEILAMPKKKKWVVVSLPLTRPFAITIIQIKSFSNLKGDLNG